MTAIVFARKMPMKKNLCLSGLMLCTLLGAGPLYAESVTFSAVAPWSAEGTAYRIASDKILFQGEFRGIMYFDGADGELDAAPFSCPARQVIQTEDGTSAASGYCAFQAPDEALVFADWHCEGVPGRCEGHMEIRGGTDNLSGISGAGKMMIRTGLSFADVDLAAGKVSKSAEGIAIWPALEIDLPGADAPN
jgi:hypothetical protein